MTKISKYFNLQNCMKKKPLKHLLIKARSDFNWKGS